ncbi:hypothetical protein EBU94_05410 [bacterium]|nr:hypothetical protein [bacterium]
MRLPQSKENPYPGLYFSWSQTGERILLAIEDADIFYVRNSGKWQTYSFVKEYWEDPDGFEVAQSHVKQAIDLVDKHHAEGTLITNEEVRSFPTHIY